MRGRGRLLARLPLLLVLLATWAAAASARSTASGTPQPPSTRSTPGARRARALGRGRAKSGGASITFVGDLTVAARRMGAGGRRQQQVRAQAGLLDGADAPVRRAGPRAARSSGWTATAIDVDVLSAADALDDLVAAGAANECDECRPLRVTDANLATGLVETSQGPAEAPMWVFTIDGTAVRVTRVAVDASITVVPPPFNADHPPERPLDRPRHRQQRLEEARRSRSRGAEGASEPCGADYTAEARRIRARRRRDRQRDAGTRRRRHAGRSGMTRTADRDPRRAPRRSGRPRGPPGPAGPSPRARNSGILPGILRVRSHPAAAQTPPLT